MRVSSGWENLKSEDQVAVASTVKQRKVGCAGIGLPSQS